MTKLIIRILALALVILFFIPMTIVSCSEYGMSYEMKISPFSLATGNVDVETSYDDAEDYTEDMEGSPIAFLALLLSVVVLIFAHKPILSIIASVINAIFVALMQTVWIEQAVLETEYGSYLTVETTAAFVLYIIINIAVIVLCIAGMVSTPHKPAAVCECGTTLKSGAKFCPKCGRAVIVPAQTSSGVPCECGYPLPPNAKFCPKCGKQLTPPQNQPQNMQ